MYHRPIVPVGFALCSIADPFRHPAQPLTGLGLADEAALADWSTESPRHVTILSLPCCSSC